MFSVMFRMVSGLLCFGAALSLTGILPNLLNMGGWIHGYTADYWIPAAWYEIAAISVATGFAVCMSVYAGIQLLRSAGRASEREDAR